MISCANKILSRSNNILSRRNKSKNKTRMSLPGFRRYRKAMQDESYFLFFLQPVASHPYPAILVGSVSSVYVSIFLLLNMAF